MAKKVKKRIKFKLIPTFLLIVGVIILYFGISYLLDKKIKNIYIYNNNLLSDQEIIELAEIQDYPSFYKTLGFEIKKKLETNPLIKDIEIKKTFFNVLKIYVTEHSVILVKNNKLVLENAHEIDYIPTKVPVLNNMTDEEIYKNLLKELNELNKSELYRISEITYSPTEYDKTRFLLYMNDGNHVYINITRFDKLNYYNEIYPTLNNKKGTLYLDSGNHFEVFK